ncbi:MAG: hypothetical protein ACFBSE_22880 [Prochloraceae cyanobacterium]
MSHSFLLEAGIWTIKGNWLERDRPAISVEGQTTVSWDRDNWFAISTKLIFPNSDRGDISSQCRGRLGNDERSYTYVVKESFLGRMEGEGWLAENSIVQRYWVLEDRKRRTGFETFYRIDPQNYVLSSGVLSGYHLSNTMEAKIKRQK